MKRTEVGNIVTEMCDLCGVPVIRREMEDDYHKGWHTVGRTTLKPFEERRIQTPECDENVLICQDCTGKSLEPIIVRASKEEFDDRAEYNPLCKLTSFLDKVRGKAWSEEELAPIWKKSQGSSFSNTSLVIAELHNLCESKQVDNGKWIYYFPTVKEVREEKNLRETGHRGTEDDPVPL